MGFPSSFLLSRDDMYLHVFLLLFIFGLAAIWFSHLFPCRWLPRRRWPATEPERKPEIPRNTVVRIQEIPPGKSLVELKCDLESFGIRDPRLEVTGKGIDGLTLARINNGDACATAIFPTFLSQPELLKRLDQARKEAGLPYVFDCDFMGITPLTDANGNDAVDIIAVPGLASHPIGSWKSSQPGNNNVWLRDFLPRDIPNARIMLYGYDTKLIRSDSRQTIEDMGIMLLNLVASVRADEQSQCRPIIFIGHSLGGLLVKECLLQAMKRQNYSSHHSLYQACCGLLLFGVPNHGLNNDQLFRVVQNQANEALIRELILDNNLESSMFLKRVSSDFSERYGSHSPVVCFYETRLSPTVQILPNGTLEKSGPSVPMVTTHSATNSVGEAMEPAIPFNVDHCGLVKFHSRSHELYIVVLERLRRLVAGAEDQLRQRISDDLSEEDQRIWTNLNDPPYSAFRNSAKLPKPEKGTLEWLLRQDDSLKSQDSPISFKSVPESQDESILGPDMFLRWRDASESSSLLVTAPPGSGKSVLSNFILHHLEAEAPSGTKVIYYFCSIRADETAPDAKSVLRSLILQLCEENATMFRMLPFDWTEKKASFRGAGLSRLLHLFGKLLHHGQLARVYCVIDGLDVYEDPEMIDLVDGLRKIWKSKTDSRTTAFLFCTSRPMRQLLDAWGPSEHCKLRCNRTDITTFIEQRVHRLGPAFNDDLKGSIKTQLLSRAEQSFLWLDVVIRRIQDLELPTPTEVNQEIDSSSRDLDDLYRYLIKRAATRSRRLVQILVMVAFAKRPLRCDELEHAAATDVTPISEKQSYQDFVQGVAHLNERNVTQALGTLLDVVDGWVLVIHQSLKDFIEHNWESLSLPISISPHAYPAYVLMRYLCLEHEDRPVQSFPLFRYAFAYWYRHVNSAAEIYAHTALKDVLRYLLSACPERKGSSRRRDLFSRGLSRRKLARSASTIAVGYDIGWLTTILLESQIDGLAIQITPDFVLKAATDSSSVLQALLLHEKKEEVPLSCEVVERICQFHNVDTLKLLLEHRGDEVIFTSRMVALAACNWVSHDDSMIRLLFSERRNDIEITPEILAAVVRYSTEATLDMVFKMVNGRIEITADLLEQAIYNPPHRGTLKFLLNRSEAKVEVTQMMLVVAAGLPQGHAVFEVLFDERGHEIYINEPVLNAAIRNPSQGLDILQLLFRKRKHQIQITPKVLATAVKAQNGIDILEFLFQQQGHQQCVTPEVMLAAASNETSDAFRLLWESNGGNIKMTPEVLCVAAGSEDGEAILELIFGRGLEDNSIPPEAMTAAAASQFGPEVLRLLLGQAQSNITEETLCAVVTNRPFCLDMLNCLVEYAASGVQITPLVALTAIGNYHELRTPLFERLLDIDPGIITMICAGSTVLAAASRDGDYSLVDLLLERGADPNFPGPNRPAPLVLAAAAGHCEVAMLLLRAGANLHARFLGGWSPLHVAARTGQHEIVDMLLREGVDINIKTNQGWSPTAIACKSGHYKTLRLLLDRGPDISPESQDGRSCLSLACEGGFFEVARLLIDTFETERKGSRSLDVHSSEDSFPSGAGGDKPETCPSLSPLSFMSDDDWNRTALWYAAAHGNVPILETLLQYDTGFVNQKDDFGISPLSAAARRGNEGAVRVLVASGLVDTESQDCIGKSALWWAGEHNHTATERLLSLPPGNSTSNELVLQEQQEEMAPLDTLSEGYCDICLISFPFMDEVLYPCEQCTCASGLSYAVICGRCVGRGGHCMDPLHQLQAACYVEETDDDSLFSE